MKETTYLIFIKAKYVWDAQAYLGAKLPTEKGEENNEDIYTSSELEDYWHDVSGDVLVTIKSFPNPSAIYPWLEKIYPEASREIFSIFPVNLLKEVEDAATASPNFEQEEPELDTAQLARIDEVENAVMDLCKIMTENDDLEWDMHFIGEIADFSASLLAKNGHKVRYPAIVTNQDGSQCIEEYVGTVDGPKEV